MKHTMVKRTLTALTIILLSQPLFSTNISPDNRFMSDNEQSVTIDASKFNNVWLKVNKNNSADAQEHLQNYLESALDNTKGTLDVAKFSAIWNKAGNNQNTEAQAHLQKALISMVDNASKRVPCFHK